ncbi:DUF5658 family protein [Desulfitobacterium hafniense]|uniref:DUF5658 family protein n=1 Tax=Desulfitobacterium hafniense TaxID=49338 RepID=UPI003D017507
MRKILILILILSILNVLDYLTTTVALANGASEGNPISNYFVSHNLLHYYKLIGVSALSIYLIIRAKMSPKSQLRITRLLYGATGFYFFILIWNLVANYLQLQLSS